MHPLSITNTYRINGKEIAMHKISDYLRERNLKAFLVPERAGQK
jgi:hypothetical protein